MVGVVGGGTPNAGRSMVEPKQPFVAERVHCRCCCWRGRCCWRRRGRTGRQCGVCGRGEHGGGAAHCVSRVVVGGRVWCGVVWCRVESGVGRKREYEGSYVQVKKGRLRDHTVEEKQNDARRVPTHSFLPLVPSLTHPFLHSFILYFEPTSQVELLAHSHTRPSHAPTHLPKHLPTHPHTHAHTLETR